MKWFGPSFLIKHRTTLYMFIAGLLAKSAQFLPPELADKLSANLADVLILVVAYFMSVKLDLEKK
jgi:hypothetical protein